MGRLAVEERRAQLLDRGLELFATTSFDAISTDEIARHAGVSKALLFHYFGSKRGYYVETIREMARLVAEATAPVRQASFEQTLRRSLEGYVAFVKDNGALYVALVRGGVGADPEVHAILDLVREASVALVLEQAAVDRPTARLKAALLGWVAFTETTTLAWFARHGFSERALIDLLIDMCLGVLEREGKRSKR